MNGFTSICLKYESITIHHLVEFAHSLGQTWSGTLMRVFFGDIKVSKRIQPAKSHFLARYQRLAMFLPVGSPY